MHSDVAFWHKLSGQPDNVTDEGIVVQREYGRRLSLEKAELRAAIMRLKGRTAPEEARHLARLAASYLLAGDAETARRYIARAEEITQDATS